ncbi:multidrug effflux MFS transporter [Aquabacter spiritensis]|uniref:DHA1 family bicyclomycin/chloramphenicol resistance-like MFS transporter n=1 Tax=Aquabacter spiritensis TaxID=933073 RepID=A0A4R3LSH5_9HYPH|nr:multidrug effflux MFS transporter [Aquabacter spiritensis]TCT03503.1 DHA1 family bicyclomycin/chloramphenicol resistance-like MFS transporter [Aquabacter spiritensis]
MTDQRRDRAAAPAPGFAEFVTIVALMMGLTAFSIDNLLPAFAPIRSDFSVTEANDLQLLVTAYMVGFGVMQIVFGTISDVVGRKAALMAGLAIYAVGCVLAMTADSFTTLLVARAIQGLGSAAARVLSVAIVRDRFQGREMARVMSFIMMVFLVIPVIAPSIGGGILLLGEWHLIFGSMFVLCLILAVWFGLRMPETLRPEDRVPLSARTILAGMRRTVSNRRTFGYSTAIGLMMGSLMAYIAVSQQTFETEIYDLGGYFPLAFAAIAGVMSLASFINAKLVRRVGMRRLSHVGVCGFTLLGLAQVVAALGYAGPPPLLLYCALLALSQALFALTVPNFNSIAMEPMGSIAGTASSFIGCYTTLVGAALGALVGRAFDGTVLPLGLGYFLLGAAAIVLVMWAEGGRLFGAGGDTAAAR